MDGLRQCRGFSRLGLLSLFNALGGRRCALPNALGGRRCALAAPSPNPPPAFYLQVWSLCLSSSIYLSMLLSICLSAFDNATMVDDKAHQPQQGNPIDMDGLRQCRGFSRLGLLSLFNALGGRGLFVCLLLSTDLCCFFICRFGLSVCLLLSTYLCCYLSVCLLLTTPQWWMIRPTSHWAR